MKNRIIFIFLITIIFFFANALFGTAGEQTCNDKGMLQTPPTKRKKISHQFEPKYMNRLSHPRSLSACGENAFCAELEGDFDAVYGDVGVEYFDDFYKANLFVPVVTSIVEKPANSNEYRIPEWEGKIFYIKINEKTGFQPLQTLYEGISDKDPNLNVFMVYDINIKEEGVQYDDEYGDYFTIELLADNNHNVVDYAINIEYADGSEITRKFKKGDSVDIGWWGTKEGDVDYIYGTTFESYVEITKDATFAYADWILGEEIPCSKCKMSIGDLPLYYRLEGWPENYDESLVRTDKESLNQNIGDYVRSRRTDGEPPLDEPSESICPAEDLEARYEAGQKSCMSDPASCGLYSKDDLEAEYQKGVAAGSTSAGGADIIAMASDLSFSVPVLQYKATPFYTIEFWADFEFSSETDGEMFWRLSGFGQN